MKKIFLGGIAATAIAAAVTLNMNISAKGDNFSDTFLANVEALAGNETGSRCTGPKVESSNGMMFYCRSENSYPCGDNHGC